LDIRQDYNNNQDGCQSNVRVIFYAHTIKDMLVGEELQFQ